MKKITVGYLLEVVVLRPSSFTPSLLLYTCKSFEQSMASDSALHFPRQRRVWALRLEDHRIFVRGSPESLNPQLGLDQQADLLPYDTKFEVPRDSIIFGGCSCSFL